MKIKKKYNFIIILVIVFVGGYFYFSREKKPIYDFIIAQKSDLIQEVSVTGRVDPVESVDLAFEKSGRISEVNVKVGDQVIKDQILVALDNADLMAQLAQDQAALESAQAGLKQYQAALETQRAKLDELKVGAKPEEIQVVETKVANAKKTLADAEVNLENVKNKAGIDLNNLYDDVGDILQDAYTKADDAVNKQIDELFSNDSSEDPQITFSTSNSQAKIDVENGRVLAGQTLETFKTEIDNLSSSGLDQALINGEGYLVIIRNFLSRLNEAVNASTGLSQATLNTYKTNINTARTNINTAISNVNSQKQSIAAQKITNQNNINSAQAGVNEGQNALTLAEDELTLKKSGATDEQIRAQEAQVKQAEINITSQRAQIKQAQAKIENVRAQLVKTVLRAPISGVVVEQKAKIGEIVSLNALVLSIISEMDFEIKSNVPEVDIANIKIDDLATVTLDAYSSDTEFKAKVIEIAPAETIIDNIPTYEVSFEFAEESDLIRSGMTADLDILTNIKKNVISIPQRAILKKGGKKIVRILNQDGLSYREVEVKTGMRGSNGSIEITEGIKDGDKIVIRIRSGE